MKFQKPENEQPSYLSKRYNWRHRPALPLHKDILLYPRVSTAGQLGNISAELQTQEDGELIKIAHELGWLFPEEWTPECGRGKIRTFPQDMAVSGRLRMEERIGFKLMLQAIISGEAGAVLCIEIDRLFRDKYGQESGKFIEICEKKGVIVITPRQIYDFRNANDVSDFKEDVARAWDYMQRQVFDKMIYAQEFLGETGRVGRGQRISIGYILDTDKKSPTFRHLIPYPPHAEIKRQLYVSYRELGNSIARLYSEIKTRPYLLRGFPDDTRPYLFPDFPENFPPRHAQAVNLAKVPGGWTVSSRSGLVKMLCDVANIGWMRHHNDVVRNEDGSPKKCHEAIVPDEEFWYVFRRHARYLPSGELNPETKRWRDRKRDDPLDAMLRPVIESAEPAHYRVTVTGGKRVSDAYYAFYDPHISKIGVAAMYASVSAQEVDNVFWRLLMPHLEATADIERYGRQEENAIASREREHQEILAQIAACDSAIAKQQAKLLKVDQDKLIEAINAEVANQEAEKARLQARLQTFLTGDTKYAEQMMEWVKLLAAGSQEIMAARTRPLEGQLQVAREQARKYLQATGEDPRAIRARAIAANQDIAATFAPRVTLELLSPRVLRMVVYWRIPDWKCEEAVWLSESAHVQFWQDDERALLLSMIGQVSPLDIMQAFPNRSWRAIGRQAHVAGRLGLLPTKSPLSTERGDWHDTLCWEDWPYVQEHELTPRRVHTATIMCPNAHLG